jgi:glyceraldehyde 3-phosphate dehydrogenase
MSDHASEALVSWQAREAHAEAIVPLVGKLYRDHALVADVFGTSLVSKTPLEIIAAHTDARRFLGRELPESVVVQMLATMVQMDLGRARVDLGKLFVRFGDRDLATLDGWMRDELQPLTWSNNPMSEQPQDVVLYGFGRIGRLVARLLIRKTGGGDKYRFRAIVLRPSKGGLARRASLLERDSVHGPFRGVVEVDEEGDALIVNGNLVKVLYANAPDELDYTEHGIHDAVVIDNTGKWRDRAGLGLHLACPGVRDLILTAPSPDIPNIVFGVNHDTLTPTDHAVSAASCTTNAIAPVLKVVNDAFGIERGHIETIHAFTNDQNLIDNYHRKDRRGRAAPLNMVITSTGAAKAVAKCLPELAGKLSGSAIRVPTPNVSLAILNLELGEEVTVEGLNDLLRKAAMDSPLHPQIDYSTSPEAVSSDLVGNHHASIVDSVATIARGNTCVLYVWYDNEFGYSCQVVRLMQHRYGMSPRLFP